MRYFLFILMLTFTFPAIALSSKAQNCKIMLSTVKKPIELTDKWEEIAYGKNYIQCWASSKLKQAIPAQQSFIGKNLELVTNPSLISAYNFSNSFCKEKNDGSSQEYPCWTSVNNKAISLIDAIKKDSDKLLFVDNILSRLVLCEESNANDYNETSQKSASCMRGNYISFSEIGRKDIDHDGIEDIALKIQFSGNTANFANCFAAIMTRKSKDSLFIMQNFTPSWRCG